MKNVTTTSLFFVLMSCWGSFLIGQSLVCNAIVNISLDGNGQATVTPEMVLEGNFDFTVLSVAPSALTLADIGIQQYTVTSSVTGNSCWGQLNVEDKISSGGTNASLACNDQVNVSVNVQGEVTILPQIVLEGGPYDFSDITVDPAVVTTADIGDDTYTATSISTGNSCWGKLNVSPSMLVYPTVNLGLDGNTDLLLSAEMFLTGTYPDYSIFTVSPESVSDTELGEIEYMITNTVSGETGSGLLQLCAMSSELTCQEATIALDMDASANFGVAQSNGIWEDACSVGGYTLSLSASSNSVSNIDLSCANLMNGSFDNYQVYLWSGNVLVDDCENILQIIDPQDACSSTSTLSCNQEVFVSVEPWKCSVDVTPEMILESSFDPNGIEMSETELGLGRHFITVTETATGNSCWGYINVEDTAPPIAIASENIVVSLTLDVNDPDGGTAKLFAISVDNGSFDSCSEVTFSPEFWVFDCDDIGVQIVELTVTDAAGNSNKTWTEVVVESKLEFELICPEDVVVSCSTNIGDESVITDLLGGYPVTNAMSCTTASINYRDEISVDLNGDGDTDDVVTGPDGLSYSEGTNCDNKVVERTWILGNTSCVQLIFLPLDNAFDEADILWPQDQEFICAGVAFQEPILSDNAGCGQVRTSVESDTFRFEDNACIKIVNNWTVLNWCDNRVYQYSSTVKINNDVAPVFEPSETALIGGISNTQLVAATANGDCPLENFSWEVEVDIDNDFSVDFELSSFLAEDELNNLWDDDDGNGVPDVRVGNMGRVDNAIGHTTLQGVTYGFRLPAFISASEDVLHRVLWTTYDGCGNVASETTYFQVLSDTADDKAPTPYCVTLSTYLADTQSGVEVNANDFDSGSFDNVTSQDDLRFTFSAVTPDQDPAYDEQEGTSIKTYPSSSINQVIDETIYVWDEAGNSDYCNVKISIVENTDQLEFKPIDFCFPRKYANTGDQVCMPLTASNFNRVSSFDCTLSWDSEVLEYQSWNNGALELASSNFNSSSQAQGMLTISWFDITVTNPVTASLGNSLFEVCFEVIGELGQESSVALTDDQISIAVSSAGTNVTDPNIIRNVSSKAGGVVVGDSDCDVTIAWPDPLLEVIINDNNTLVIEDIIRPTNLIDVLGFSESQVIPQFQSACLVGYNYEDIILPVLSGESKVIRTFIIINWDTGESFEFVQIIKVRKELSFICDILARDTPVGDCNSGHSATDDVEWPADISIADHRITPAELVQFSDVLVIDSEPQFFNNPDLYSATYEDVLDGLTTEALEVDRVWSVTRVGSPGYIWNFTQDITIDLVELTNLVTVATPSVRPMPAVQVTDQIMTNDSGMAIVDGNDELDLQYDDEIYNGVNIKDLILMRNHILGLKKLSGIQEYVGDINKDGRVSTLDLVELQRFLVGIDTPNDMSWDFIDQFELADINGDPAPVLVQTKGQFTGIKPGDVDDNAVLSNEANQYQSVQLTYEDELWNSGQIYSIPLTIDEDHSLWGVQLKFDIDESLVEVLNVTSSVFGDEIQYAVVNGELNLLNITQTGQAQSVDALDALITLEVRAKANTVLSKAISVAPEQYSLFVKNADMEIFTVNTELQGMIGSSILELADMQLKVYPNPAVHTLNLNFSGSDLQLVDFAFTIYDGTGKEVKTIRNEYNIDVSDLSEGCYFYTITMDEMSYTDRFMIVK